ncbi:putative reverse transcriptase domain-containing protein, partial [Tanacetum coccineum]
MLLKLSSTLEKCNMRIKLGITLKEPTNKKRWSTCSHYKLSSIPYPPLKSHHLYASNMVFREILNICPKVPGKAFDEPPTEEEALSFIRELGHTREIKYMTDVIVDHLHQPWRTFASIINKCLCGKVSSLDKIRLSRVQILWGMYYKKNLDFAALIWEDLAYKIDRMDFKKQDKMFYPRFIKIIIDHFLTKDKSISMRNRMFMHTSRDNSLLGIIRFIPRHADTLVYGAILSKEMMNQALLDSVAYKTYYAIASGVEPPKSGKILKKFESTILSKETPSKKKSAKAKKPVTKPKPSKKKAPVKANRGKDASGSGDGTHFESGIPDEHQQKTSGIDEGTSTKPGVPDVPKYDSESNKEFWGHSGEEDNDDDDEETDDGDDDDGNDDDGDSDDNDDDSDDKRMESHRDEIPDPNQTNVEQT